ncbi:hypothetical protein BC834DRAFT_1026134 [Gloeopeniophorella convolvens]|nr:hypothetical protein BC834DRAFT_1026134 [Gloeopeniophorella convolvens]
MEPITQPADNGPIPLSFPSILRNPGLNSRYSYLRESTRPASAPAQPKKVRRRDDNEGKRWVQRRENARFTGNPHITAPSRRDLDTPIPVAQATFPIPLPPYLPRSVSLPASVPPQADAKASSAGQFSLSLRGMRKALRRSGPHTQVLVRDIEDELTRWLGEVEVVLNPSMEAEYDFPGRAIGGQERVREVERSAQRLVWWIEGEGDTWTRYVVHCCARYHGIVSFSKDTSTHRLTHILRPNVIRPDPAARVGLVTPPTTDMDLSSLSSYDSDMLSSLSDVPSSADDSEPEGGRAHTHARALSDIASDDGREADAESDLESAAGALSLADAEADDATHEETPRPVRRIAAYRSRVWDRTRSGSSPSRSPARRAPRRRVERKCPCLLVLWGGRVSTTTCSRETCSRQHQQTVPVHSADETQRTFEFVFRATDRQGPRTYGILLSERRVDLPSSSSSARHQAPVCYTILGKSLSGFATVALGLCSPQFGANEIFLSLKARGLAEAKPWHGHHSPIARTLDLFNVTMARSEEDSTSLTQCSQLFRWPPARPEPALGNGTQNTEDIHSPLESIVERPSSAIAIESATATNEDANSRMR